MKKTISIFMLAALLIGGLTGCYEDKGNYKYRDINEVTYKILPESEDGYYRFKQPPVDTMYVDYTVDLSQSQATNEENLEFLWLVSYSKDKKTVTDTITTRDLRLTFPPKKSSAFDIVFSLTDKQTNVSSYKELHIKIVYPYINSWLVLNGDKEDSRISAVEDPDSLNYFFTEDAYTALGYKKRFKDITELVYAPVITGNGNAPEWLYIASPDSVWALFPFEMKVEKKQNDILPEVITENNTKVAYGLDGSPSSGGAVILVDENKRFYYSTFNSGRGKFQVPEIAQELNETYQVDLIAKSQKSSYLCFWDDERDKFLYFNLGGGGEITLFPEEYNDWTGKEVIWMGTDNKDKEHKDGIAMAIVKDTKDQSYWTYRLSTEQTITGDSIGELPINKDSQFATTSAFPDQFFYTVDSKVYLFNVASLETYELYDAGSPITKMQFRITEDHQLTEEWNYMQRCLALAVDKGDKGELHELTLTTAGDIETSRIFEGFGPIKDMCFTFINRILAFIGVGRMPARGRNHRSSQRRLVGCSEYRRTGKGASEHQIQRAAGGFADCDHPQRSGYGQRTVELRYPAIGRYPPGAGIPPCREVRSTYPEGRPSSVVSGVFRREYPYGRGNEGTVRTA